jgi:hypothetical protein
VPSIKQRFAVFKAISVPGIVVLGFKDPAIFLLHRFPRTSGYWDRSGLSGLKYFTKAVLSNFHSKPPEIDDENNAKEQLRNQ